MSLARYTLLEVALFRAALAEHLLALSAERDMLLLIFAVWLRVVDYHVRDIS